MELKFYYNYYDLFKLLNYCNYMYKFDELKRKEKNNKNWVFFFK